MTLADRLAALPAEKLALLACEARDRLSGVPSEPIAIVGMACRFPGGARTPEALWELLRSGRSAVTEVPASRWDVERYYDPRVGTPGKMYTRHGAFVDAVDRFDAEFFGVSPREAAGMDPQQRLLLETAWHALDDAGVAAEPRPTSAIGVFVGIMNHDYALLLAATDDPHSHTGSGNGLSVAAGRLSHAFGLHGPTLAVDTACSSSLVALHLACRALHNGEAQLALAGGVNLILSPISTIVECEMRMLAPDGRCKAFDAAADGFVRGEGCGVVVLKRMSDALRDGDRVHALIRGSAVNHDGHSGALTVPNGPAQEQVIRAALRDAGVSPAQVAFVEAHGTGTALGDPIEVAALARAYDGQRDGPLAIGSIKTNLGHTESAAGVAGLFRAVLALQHGAIPPHLNLDVPSHEVDWEELGIRVPTALEPWPGGAERRLAGVSSFGFSGTNAHVVLEAAPVAESVAAPGSPPYLLALSAASEGSLRTAARELSEHLAGYGEGALAGVCTALQSRRSHLRHRAILTVSAVAEARERLHAVAAGGDSAPGTARGVASGDRPRVAFLFTGNGAQYDGMGRILYEELEPAREVLERCAAIAAESLSQPLIDVLAGTGDAAGLLDRADYAQPALYALQCALGALWRSWGVEPDIVAGHSTGEYAAAHLAGVFDLETGMRLMLARGRLLRALPDGGGMLSCFADAATVSAALADAPSLAIAAVNAPRNVAVAGPRAQLGALSERLEGEGIGSRWLRVDRAFHSSATEPVLDEFRALAGAFHYAPPRIPVVSSVTGALVEHELTSAEYWTRHMRQPVRFAAAVETVLAREPDACLEIGPKATLVGLGAACAAERSRRTEPRWLASLRRESEDRRPLLDAAGVLASIGVPLRWEVLGPGGSVHAPLPQYPFEAQRHWTTAGASGANGASAPSRASGGGHPLLGPRLRLAGGERRYETELGRNRPAFARDHRLHGMAVLPGAAIVDLLLAAGRELHAGHGLRLEQVVFRRPVLLGDAGLRTLQTVVEPSGPGPARVELFMLDDQAADPRWISVASGRVSSCDCALGAPASCADAGVQLDVEDYYEHFRAGGLDYGPDLRCIQSLACGPGWSRAELVLPPAPAADDPGYVFHPVLVDGALQAIGAALPRGDERPWVPAGIGAVQLGARPSATVTAHVTISGDPGGSLLHAEIDLVDAHGALAMRLTDVRLMPVTASSLAAADLHGSLYSVRYEPRVRTLPAAPLELPSPREVATLLAPQLGRLRADESLRDYAATLEAIDALVPAYVARALERMGWLAPSEPFTLDGLMAELGVSARFERLMGRLLELLAGAGALHRQDGGYRADAAILSRLRGERALDEGSEEGAPAPVESILLRRCGERLHDVLCGTVDPLELLFEDGDAAIAESLYEDSPGYAAMNGLVRAAVQAFTRERRPGAGIRVLEVGGGTGGTTAHILPALPPDACEYVFTDVSQHFLARAQRKFGAYGFLRTAILDLDVDPLLQGQHAGRYDLLVASNVVHATACLRDTLARLRALLAPGGRLILVEAMASRPWLDVTFGLTDGWWSYEDAEDRTDGPLVGLDAWVELLGDCGFCDIAPLTDGQDDRRDVQAAVLLAGVPASAPVLRTSARHLVLLADEGGVAAGLAELGAQSGRGCTLVWPGPAFERRAVDEYVVNPDEPDEWARLLGDCVPETDSPCEIVDLWSLDVPRADALDVERLQAAVAATSARALALLPALIDAARESSPILTFVTAGACPVRDAEAVPDVAGALLAGLAGAIDGEQPAVSCRCVDLDPSDPQCAASVLLDELTVGDERESVAFRAGSRFAARLARWHVPDAVTEGRTAELRADGAYLITGGLGGLGLLTADWAAQRGAGRLLLVGRSAPGADAQAVIARLEQQGVTVSVHAADIASDADFAALRDAVSDLEVPLRGIFHSAGALADGRLMGQDRWRFELPFHAKVLGSWRLAELALRCELDMFVLYSSAVALLGSPGQANHRTACAFQDVLAHHLRARGVPALSINWGAWSDVGSAADPELLMRLRARGMDPITPAAGLAALDLLLQAPQPTQVAVIPIDWPTVLAGLAGAPASPLLAPLLAAQQALMAGGAVAVRDEALLAKLAAAAPDQVEQELLDYLLRALGAVLGRTLGPDDAERSLLQLGLDSLLAMELRNRMLAELELDLPLERLIEGATAAELAPEMATLLLTLLPDETNPQVVYEEFAL